MTRRVGIFPGTFDPVHQGHIAFSLETMRICSLDEVVLLPEAIPRGKFDVTDISSRVDLLNKTLASTPGLKMVTLNSQQFTVKDTFPELLKLYDGSDLTFLLGSDSLRTLLYRWDGLNTLLSKVSLAIGLRRGATSEEITSIIKELEKQLGLTIRSTIIESSYSDMASSDIRSA